ncbi:glutathione S-transferase [Thioalkalivibrio sp. HK1]|uniref:glutathione S-transferase n=1 Tax=Thioalkalivibrio sp. HK1 TaxID=1469245 RepID=UPI00046EC738|nr:glutathione S-transferase [Thioalkalivibrio sp. HK1]
MRLFYSPSSPYARKVRILAHEAALLDRIELVSTAPSPTAVAMDLNAANPLGKIPCLITDEGESLFDSRVICEYIDSMHDQAPFFPASGASRWQALTMQSLADGILDAAVITRYETFLRPSDLRWNDWVEAQLGKIRRALDRIESAQERPNRNPDIGSITLAAACGYLDFRYADENWRDLRPNLAHWYEEFAGRPSMQETAPE